MTSTNQAKLNYKIILNTHTGLKFNQANNPANLLAKSVFRFNFPTLDECFDAFENEAARLGWVCCGQSHGVKFFCWFF